MNLPPPHTPNPRQHSPRVPRRPASIAELAERALVGLWDDNKDLKYYLRIAEKYRRDGTAFHEKGDYENAFVEFARAATLVLEKLPTHRDYHTLLNTAQRHNLGLNGQDILDSLSKLKPALVERYEKWVEAHPNGVGGERTPEPPHRRATEDDRIRQSQVQAQRQDENNRLRAAGMEQERRMAEEAERWKQHREEAFPREERERSRYSSSVMERKKDAAVAAARQAAAQGIAGPDYTFSRPPGQVINGHDPQPGPSMDARRQEDNARYQYQQEEMRKREEEITRRRTEQKRKQEQEGILKRQQETENAARAARQTISNDQASLIHATANLGIGSSSTSVIYQPAVPTIVPPPASTFYQSPSYPSASSSNIGAIPPPPPSFPNPRPQSELIAPSIMPLESPTKYEGDSTDSESVHNHATEWRRGKHKQVPDNLRTPTRAPVRSSSFPPPVTTTSPPPPDRGPIQYPMLMSQHQKRQGYQPSLHSMFVPGPELSGSVPIPSSLLFVPESQGPAQVNRALYPSEVLPTPSAPPNGNYSYGIAPPPPPPQQQPYQHPPQPHSYPGPSRPPPPIPAPPLPPTASAAPTLIRSESERIIRSQNPNDTTPSLKTVTLPRECLPRFLAIAKVNTQMNKETCGLLLGKDKGQKFAVTTLLIPKQHSTSDTCTMDEEELVLQFTEERSLITLGWIHTHPSQSCFMSSVDLHTHSGFQRMLPESFAVVCAPKSNPNFGIFRLTDPPGLQTVLQCTAKEAFHPHPDLPIYTDADKGHVQMKDATLEIVDLR